MSTHFTPRDTISRSISICVTRVKNLSGVNGIESPRQSIGGEKLGAYFAFTIPEKADASTRSRLVQRAKRSIVKMHHAAPKKDNQGRHRTRCRPRFSNQRPLRAKLRLLKMFGNCLLMLFIRAAELILQLSGIVVPENEVVITVVIACGSAHGLQTIKAR